jgi:hypothetical protein
MALRLRIEYASILSRNNDPGKRLLLTPASKKSEGWVVLKLRASITRF